MNAALKRTRTMLFGSYRRGVVSILAMMFLVLFGSLGLAMAIASKGNMRTAETNLYVNKAMGAAETGLSIAQNRLAEAAGRFVVTKGTITGTIASHIWSGSTSSSDGTISVLPPPSGYAEYGLPRGIAQALMNQHSADQNVVTYAGGATTPVLGNAPTGTDPSVYLLTNWVTTPAVAFDSAVTVAGAAPAAFQITYAPLANGTDIRIFVTGFSSVSASGSNYMYSPGSGSAGNRPLTRTIQQDFHITKRHKQVVLGPSRLLVGRNVQVIGNLGVQASGVQYDNGQPLIIRSDFYGLDPILDQKLDALYAGIAQYDVDGDNRLRVNHPVESKGIPSNSTDYNHDGMPDNAFNDVTKDGYVDDFDVFINHFDANHDGKVVLSKALTRGTPAENLDPEFTLDDDLAILIDGATPDRNHNGISGFVDTNNNGRWDAGEQILDYDPVTHTYPDQVLGWRDGVIDYKDAYAKVHGRIEVKVTQASWESAQGPYRSVIQGPIADPEAGTAPISFGQGADVLPAISASSFADAANTMAALATGGTFAQQAAAQLNVSTGALGSYVETKTDSTKPRYFNPATMSDAAAKALTGQDLWERMPINSPSYSDWYIRPRYENMTFTDVQIPMGNNALFVNCTFIGITDVHTYVDDTHPNWALYGALVWDVSQGKPVAPTAPLDKSDFLRYTTGNVSDGPANYTDFPDPPKINGVTLTGAARDTKQYSNNIRFHNCLFVGSLVSDTPAVFVNTRNKFQFTGSTQFTDVNPNAPSDPAKNPTAGEMAAIESSSMLVPNYSVDVGQFNSPTDTFANGPTPQNVQLKGTIVAGVLDIRGTTTINGTLLMTFEPILGQTPLLQYGVPVGNPSNYNVSLNYFGSGDGDQESFDPASLPIVNGQKIVGWDLDGDGLPDLPPTETPTAAQLAAGAKAIPFYGYGRVVLNWNPDLPMPDGIPLPLSVLPIKHSYKEGKH